MGAALWPLLHSPGCVVFIAGSAKSMPSDVTAALRAVVQRYGRVDEAAAGAVIARMVRERRLVIEAWS